VEDDVSRGGGGEGEREREREGGGETEKRKQRTRLTSSEEDAARMTVVFCLTRLRVVRVAKTGVERRG
jgi:hypothetical protein